MLLVRRVKSSTDSSGGLMLIAPALKLLLSSAPLSMYEVPASLAPPDVGDISSPGLTEGAINGRTSKMSRSTSAACWIVELSTSYARSEVAVCTSGTSAVTSTSCEVLANSSWRLKGTTWLASTTTPETLTPPKLAALISRV